MRVLELLPIGNFDERLLREVAPALADAFRVRCRIGGARLDPQFAFHPERQQYHSSELLHRLQDYAANGAWRVLGVTNVDLYIPILTFVFGEAQVGGPCAVVSAHRLAQEFYGLPPDPALLRDRLIKEAVHEVGHTLDLTHCDDYACVMAASHAVEWIDLKEATLCASCRSRALEAVG
ncbi:MAG: archaemetzincin family Zn-dependent metalloprotease [Terriglobales bacterium]